jgi:glycosyltransferase involved in cell wall biosynthesis
MENNKRLKIAYITDKDYNDKNSWSGTIYRIGQSLQEHCGDVYPIGPLKTRLKYVPIITNHLTTHLMGKNYDVTHSSIISKAYARKINKKLNENEFDIIFAPTAFNEIAYLDVDIPIVYLSDATFSLFVDYRKYCSNLLDRSIKESNNIEKLAINKANLLLFSSRWAANSAINDYGADESKVFVVPFGANLDKIPDKNLILQKKKSKKCKLLYLGVQWERKGGDIAFDTLLELEKLGIEAELVVCGVIPPEEFKHKNMTVIPFLDKNNEQQSKELEKLFIESDFFILPTRREAFGIVFCEASAFGLPSIATDTGGVSGVITNKENGFMLPLDAKAADYAELIKKIYLDDELYYNLVKSSRELFENQLNWDQWGKTVFKLINNML